MATYGEVGKNKETQEVAVPLGATRQVLLPSYKARIIKDYKSPHTPGHPVYSVCCYGLSYPFQL